MTARADLWPVATVFKKIRGCRCERFFKTGFPEHPFSFEDSGSAVAIILAGSGSDSSETFSKLNLFCQPLMVCVAVMDLQHWF